MTSEVKVIDHGLQRLLDRLGKKFMVTVGVHEAQGAVPHKERERSFNAIDKAGKALQKFEGMADRGKTSREARFMKRLAKFDARPQPKSERARARRAVRRALIVAASQDMTRTEMRGHIGAAGAEMALNRYRAQRARNIERFGDKKRAIPTLIEVAGFHEFGFGVPRRSFIADWFDQNEQTAHKTLRKICGNHIQGKEDLKTSLTKFSAWAVGDIQQRIEAGIPPLPLAPSTIRQKKGKAVPLINTGQLRSSIRGRVRVEK